jgi:DNA-binding beta-propeller fold protein YncE
MALSAGCRRKVGAGFQGFALIATEGEKSISVVDLARFRLTRQIGLGEFPSMVVSGTERSYVLTPHSGSVHCIEHGRDFQRGATRKLAGNLAGFKLTSDGKHLLAIASSGHELIEAETSSLRVSRKWKLRGAPRAIDVSVDGAVAISTGEKGIVEFIDRKTGRRYAKELDGALGEVRFRADGKLLIVANCHAQSLTSLDIPSLETVVDLPLAMQPEHLCFSADGGQLFVSGQGMDGIAIAFTYLPLEIEQTVLGGRDPGVMACSDNPAYLFVASASGSDVCVLTIARRKMIGLVEVGRRPSFIAITPDSRYALVLNEGSGDMAVIRITSIQEKLGDAEKKRDKAGASLFTMLPVGAQPVHAAIVRQMV